MKISNEKLWHTPIKAYSDYLREVEVHGLEAVMKLGKFQKARETRALAVLCFAMYKIMDTPWYLQLDQSEVTDGRIMRQSPGNPGDSEKGNVEITTCMRHGDGSLPAQSLLEQLKRKKTFETFHKYGPHDLILVDLGSNMIKEDGVDFDALSAYLRSINAPYALWAIEQIEHDNEDTIVQITVCMPEVQQYRMNVGEAWAEQMDKGVRGTLVSQRTSDSAKADIKLGGEPITRTVWDFED